MVLVMEECLWILKIILDNILTLTDRTSMASLMGWLDTRSSTGRTNFGTKPSWNLHNNFSKSNYALKKIAKSYLPSKLWKHLKLVLTLPLILDWTTLKYLKIGL